MKQPFLASLVVMGVLCALSSHVQAAVGDGLLAHWKLDETSGTTAVDSVAGTYNADNIGNVNPAVVNQAGVVGTAYQFNDTEDNVLLSAAAPTGITDFTISAWGYTDFTRSGTTASSRSTIFGQTSISLLLSIGEAGNANDPAKVITYYNSSNDGGSGITFKTAPIINVGQWYHFAFTRSGTDVVIYVNGQNVYTGTGATGMVNGLSDMMIGRYSAQLERDWGGKIDDVGLWGAAKSAEEVALMHGLGSFVGVSLDDTAIDNVLTAFNAGSGNSASAGGYTWNYVSGLSSSTLGETGGSVGGGDAWIALDSSGNGVQIGAAAFHPGDANGDGMVNLADLQILGDNWQSTTATWAQADFTGDGNVNLADLQILGDNWAYGVGPDLSFDEALAQVSIPEPATLLLLGVGGLLLARRR